MKREERFALFSFFENLIELLKIYLQFSRLHVLLSSYLPTYILSLILLPLIRALHAPEKLRHRFIRRPRLYHQKIRHVVRAFRAPTSRRVHVFPRVVPT